jgi:hypothetical protein
MLGQFLSLLSFTILCSCLLITIVAHVLQSVNPWANYMHGTGGYPSVLRWLRCLSTGTHPPGRVLHVKAACRWHPLRCVPLLWPKVGQHRVKKHSSKNFRSQRPWSNSALHAATNDSIGEVCHPTQMVSLCCCCAVCACRPPRVSRTGRNDAAIAHTPAP